MTVIRAALEYVGDGFSEPLTADPVTYDPFIRTVPGAAFLGGHIYRNAGGGTGQGTHPVTNDLMITLNAELW